MKYAFIRTQEQTHRISRLCTALAVSRSGYYAWRERPVSARAAADQHRLPVLRDLHQQTREGYGAVKLWRMLKTRGVRCGRHRVARLRKLAGLEARRVRRFRVMVEHHQLPPPAPNRLHQCFVTTGLNRVWVGDVTHVPTRAGWLYAAVLLDLYSRRAIGWAIECSARSTVDAGCLGHGGPPTSRSARPDSSLRSRRAIQRPSLSTATREPRHGPEHEPEGQLL